MHLRSFSRHNIAVYFNGSSLCGCRCVSAPVCTRVCVQGCVSSGGASIRPLPQRLSDCAPLPLNVSGHSVRPVASFEDNSERRRRRLGGSESLAAGNRPLRSTNRRLVWLFGCVFTGIPATPVRLNSLRYQLIIKKTLNAVVIVA